MARYADVVCGLGFGDEGKGVTVARLADRAIQGSGAVNSAVVRYSGGPQNAHNVCWRDEEGRIRHHKFAQTGASGQHVFSTDAYTAEYVPVDPLSLFSEADVLLGNGHDDVRISEICNHWYFHENSLLILPLHERASKIRERKLKHGSTGRGIFEVNKFSETYPESAPRLGDLKEPSVLFRKVEAFVSWVNAGMPDEHSASIIEKAGFAEIDASSEVRDFLDFCAQYMKVSYKAFLRNVLPGGEWYRGVGEKERLVFEGGQGILLDKSFGFFPNVTFSNTTPLNAVRIIDELNGLGKNFDPVIHGVTRTYATRHGAGMLPHEMNPGEPAYENFRAAEPHNTASSFAGDMRFAPLSRDLLDYAIKLCELCGGKLSRVHITHCDTARFSAMSYDMDVFAEETAVLVHAFRSDDELRRGIVNDFGRRIASSRKRSIWYDPVQVFEGCDIRCHDNPFV
jgi:adenylosuccinate synthase